MTTESYARCTATFREAFGREEWYPTWNEIGHLDETAVMTAIARVKANPMTAKGAKSIAAKVVDASMATGKRSRFVAKRREI